MDLKRTLSVFLLALLTILSTASECGNTIYDPSKYVCWYGAFLCPYQNGSPLAYCNGACYSPWMYHCDNGILALNTITTAPVQLTASNPSVPELDGYPVNACSQKFNTGKPGKSCTYCPKDVVPNCPNSTETVVYPEGGLSVYVPGGQQWYVDSSGALGFTQPHSAYIPAGSQTSGFQAYEFGALVNLESPYGWIACMVSDHGWSGPMYYVSQQMEPVLRNNCYGIDLLVKQPPMGFAVWEYT